jgi:hypothetical protein
MAAAKPNRASPGLVNPFKEDSRRKAFEAALKTLAPIIRNPEARRRQAMRVARRVTVAART